MRIMFVLIAACVVGTMFGVAFAKCIAINIDDRGIECNGPL